MLKSGVSTRIAGGKAWPVTISSGAGKSATLIGARDDSERREQRYRATSSEKERCRRSASGNAH